MNKRVTVAEAAHALGVNVSAVTHLLPIDSDGTVDLGDVDAHLEWHRVEPGSLGLARERNPNPHQGT